MLCFTKSLGRIAGPAAVMTAGAMGAGTASTFILAGAWFRYELIWLVVLVVPLYVVSVDSASRIGMVNPDKGMLSLIRERIHPGIAWLILGIMIPLHLFIAMGHMSIMTSAFLSSFGYHPPNLSQHGMTPETYRMLESALALILAAALIWLLSSGGYQRMQRLMTIFMLLMFICFFSVAVRAFSEIVAIVGSVLAPSALLGIPYMSADNTTGIRDFKGEIYKSVVNLGLIFGLYSLFVIIAGGFALYPLENNGEIDSVHEASKILLRAFPANFAFLGPVIFSIGIFMAGLTTFVVVIELLGYFCLDMFSNDWHNTNNNRNFKYVNMALITVPAVLAPHWSFPALFKNLLLMGANTIVIPVVYLVVISLVNKSAVMGEHTAGRFRNTFLIIGFVLALGLSVVKLPSYIAEFSF